MTTELSLPVAILLVTAATYGWLALAQRDAFTTFAEYVVVGALWSGLQSFLLVVYAVAGWKGMLQVLLILLDVMAES